MFHVTCRQGYIEALAAGVNWTTVTHFLGHPLTRLQEAFHRGDLAAARLEQVTLTLLPTFSPEFKP